MDAVKRGTLLFVLPVKFLMLPVTKELFDDAREGDAGPGCDALALAFFDAIFIQVVVDPVGG